MSAHEVVRFASMDALVAAAAERIAEAATAAVAARGRFVCALSGGSTPRPVYARLATLPGVPWEHTTLVYGDERCVAADDERSNHRMVRETLLHRLPPAAQGAGRPTTLPMPGERADRDAAAAAYAAEIRAHCVSRPTPGDTPVLDLVLLGLGTDGHTASLFPGSPLLEPGETRLVAPSWSEATSTHRLTLTPRLIRAARARLFLVAGAAKADVLARALDPDTDLPAGCVGPGEWLVSI